MFNKKGKQCPYKPGSVLQCLGTTVSAIYLNRLSPDGSSVLPSTVTRSGGHPQTVVYMNLQPPEGTARLSPDGWWSLTPPSHPCHSYTWRSFSSACSHCHQWLPFSEVERPALPGLSSRHPHGGQRQTVALLSKCKVTKKLMGFQNYSRRLLSVVS